LSSISDAVFLTDDEGRLTYICPNVDVIFGWAPDEVQAMGRIAALLGEALFDRGELDAQGELRNIERDVAHKSGDRRIVLVNVKRVSINDGTMLYTCRDVTDLRRAEEQLRVVRRELAHASRLALLGELSASIGHEIAQPLSAIALNARIGLRVLDQAGAESGRAIREVLTEIRDQSQLAGDFIHRLGALAGRRPLESRRLDLNELIADMLPIVRGDVHRRSVALRTAFAPSLPAVTGDRVSLQQVVLNLLRNATDAVEGASRERQVTIGTRRVGDAVEVTVADTGRGIRDDELPRLFDPFFTTKPEGLGLGLAISRTIVEGHGGRIWAETGAESGATFHVTLPATEPSPSTVAEQ
jgi:PAS domain S-box-containing protein